MSTTFVPSFPSSPDPWTGSGNRRVFVLMSGGVDSSTAALLLKQQGWEVAGITMNILTGAQTSISDAATVCRQLEIPHFSLDLKEEFRLQVIAPFCKEYEQGRTPNPCILCNAHFKFGLLWDRLEEHFSGPFHVASGHYARTGQQGTTPYLGRAKEHTKDQSYFLCHIPFQRIEHLLLPLGELCKEQTRAAAKGAGLHVAEKKDSMEICFTGEGDYRTLLQHAHRPGLVFSLDGPPIGRHNGIANYTLGQRKGLGISSPEALYVIHISPAHNSLTVGTREQAYQNCIHVNEVNILNTALCRPGVQLFAKIRSGGPVTPCRITRMEAKTLDILFETPQFAPAPGQTAALYDASGHLVAGALIQDERD